MNSTRWMAARRLLAGALTLMLVVGMVPMGALASDETAADSSSRQVELSEGETGQPLPDDQEQDASSSSENELESVAEELPSGEDAAGFEASEIAAESRDEEGEDQQDGGASEGDASNDASAYEGAELTQGSGAEPSLVAQAATIVTYIPATSIEFVLGSVEWDSWDKCYYYQYNSRDGDLLKVESGGAMTTYVFDEERYGWKGPDGYEWMEVQLYARLSESQNTLGSHSMTVDYFKNSSFEARGTVVFSLVESPLESISYQSAYPIILVNGVDSSKYYEYDQATKKGHTYSHYFFPTGSRLMGDELTLNYADGTTKSYVYMAFKNPEHGYDDQGWVNTNDASDIISVEDVSITADQTYAHRWRAGWHSFAFNYLGKTTQVPVLVKLPTVTKVSYTHSPRYAYTTKAAITYTKKLGIYEGSYASKVTKHKIVFAAPQPEDGDVLKVTADDKTATYVCRVAQGCFVNKDDANDTIPMRDVTIESLVVGPTVTKAAFPCSYQGVSFSIPFNVTKAKQKVKASRKEVVVGKKVSLGITSTGFANTRYKCTSSNSKIATANTWGLVTAKKIGKTKITIVARSNVAYGASAAKTITVKVGKKNPFAAKAKKAKVVIKAKTLKKKKVTCASNVRITKRGYGAVSYVNASKGAVAKTFKVNAKTGKLTIKRGTKKGTYVVKIKVKAKGNSTYISRTRTVKFKVVVK